MVFFFVPKNITNIKDVFSILNVSLDYVVQRNFHEIFDRENAEHGDIDLLVSDPKAAALVVGATLYIARREAQISKQQSTLTGKP